jgi:hypothetical protein
MAPTKFQLEESKKPNPRCVLDLHTIRGMVKEADMDKALHKDHPCSHTTMLQCRNYRNTHLPWAQLRHLLKLLLLLRHLFL